MSKNAEVVVVGCGAMGAAVLYQLAKRGVKALGVDRYRPPHVWGSSHGETRVTRQALGEGRAYVPFALASHTIWRELEEETGTHLLQTCGALLIAPTSGLTPEHKKANFVNRAIDAAKTYQIPHEVMSGAEAKYRFPQFVGLSGDENVCYEPGGGYVIPELCISTQLSRAEALGAEVHTGVSVFGIESTSSSVRINTSSGLITAERVIVCAGAWNTRLLGNRLSRLLKITRQVLNWYGLNDLSSYQAGSPCFIWMHGLGDSDYMYGFPPMPNQTSIKVSTEQYAVSTSVEDMDRQVSPKESREMYTRHAQNRLAGVTPRVVQSAACMYTVTPDRSFIIDDHPDMDRVFVVSACSGHGFKHSSGIGRAVAAKIVGDADNFDLPQFSFKRFNN